MTLDDFRKSLTSTEPPAGLTLALAGLWWDAKGNWTRAYESAQQDEGMEGSWVSLMRNIWRKPFRTKLTFFSHATKNTSSSFA